MLFDAGAIDAEAQLAMRSMQLTVVASRLNAPGVVTATHSKLLQRLAAISADAASGNSAAVMQVLTMWRVRLRRNNVWWCSVGVPVAQ